MIHTQARALKNRTFEPYGHARVAVGGMMEGRGSFGGLLEWQKAPEPLAQPPYDAHTGPSPKKKKKKPNLGVNGGLQSATGAWGWGWGVWPVPPSRWARQ